ncbi:hypothetical protein [Leptospira idonii]|uniref:Uncharacterized protein n=1 Tax=Leptospira idonii TaxID=1193500 RepID=A0A4R9M4U8_9LEPT|nr:hypothetical protein [Leptospira idonii]TGN20269.1 hypothetical protein EHS15_04605 [Leptospira idonii]
MRSKIILILLMFELNGCSINGMFDRPYRRDWTSEIQVEDRLVKIHQERRSSKYIWIWPLHFHGGGWYPTGPDDYYTLSRNEDLGMLEDYEDRGYSPIILNSYQGKLYMVLSSNLHYYYTKKDPYRTSFKVLRLDKGYWKEISFYEFPRQISYQNVNQWHILKGASNDDTLELRKEDEITNKDLTYRIDFLSELKEILKQTENEAPDSSMKVFPDGWSGLNIFPFWLCLEYPYCNRQDTYSGVLTNKTKGRLNLRFIRNYVKKNFPDEEAKPANTPEVN